MAEFQEAAAATDARLNISIVDFGQLSLADQIAAVADTDIMIGSHGASMVHLMWLPPWGVSVELMPYKFGPYNEQWEELDFYYGYANWAHLARRSHIVWHNRNRRQVKSLVP